MLICGHTHTFLSFICLVCPQCQTKQIPKVTLLWLLFFKELDCGFRERIICEARVWDKVLADIVAVTQHINSECTQTHQSCYSKTASLRHPLGPRCIQGSFVGGECCLHTMQMKGISGRRDVVCKYPTKAKNTIEQPYDWWFQVSDEMKDDVGKSKKMFLSGRRRHQRHGGKSKPRNEARRSYILILMSNYCMCDSPYRPYLFEWQPKQHTSYCPSSPWH